MARESLFSLVLTQCWTAKLGRCTEDQHASPNRGDIDTAIFSLIKMSLLAPFYALLSSSIFLSRLNVCVQAKAPGEPSCNQNVNKPLIVPWMPPPPSILCLPQMLWGLHEPREGAHVFGK